MNFVDDQPGNERHQVPEILDTGCPSSDEDLAGGATAGTPQLNGEPPSPSGSPGSAGRDGGGGRPFAFGDLVVFVDAKQRRRLQRLQPGRVFQAPPGGAIRHDDVAGLPEGAVVSTTTGQPILCLRPTLEEYILAMPRRTQVIYPKDLGQILIRSNLGPGGRALEAGVGSGATSLALLRLLGPTGTLVSYERRPEFAELARDNVRRFLGEDPPNWRIELRDVYEGIDERDLDAVVLDVPEPYRCVEAAAAAVRPGGVLLVWLPTTNQVQQMVVALRRHPAWDLVDTTELLLRPWHVSQESVRPEHRMVAHTGFLITARRVTGPAPLPSRP
ncbi:MAG: tRNA (adenine-N1)-methyltransferase [Symbiobacteriaceae bacterium]